MMKKETNLIWKQKGKAIMEVQFLFYTKDQFNDRVIQACREGDITFVKKAGKTKKLNVNVKDRRNGATPLYVACQHGQVDIVKLLLSARDIDPNMPLDDKPITPITAVNNDDDASKQLITTVNKPPVISQYESLTTIQQRRLKSKLDIIDDYRYPSPRFSSPLIIACARGHLAAVRLLLGDKRISVKRSVKGFTPLLAAVINGQKEVVKLLLQHGDVDINFKGAEERTALHIACREGNLEIVKLLVEHKEINVDALDERGILPIEIAKEKGFDDIVNILKVL